jgi:hypothetical protein
MAKEALSPREKLLTVTDVAAAAAPVDGVTEPHFILSPKGSGGDPCVGFSFTLFAPTVGGAAFGAGATLIPWRLRSVIGRWSTWETYTPYSLGQELFCYDVGAGAKLYFQITGATVAGDILMAVEELT